LVNFVRAKIVPEWVGDTRYVATQGCKGDPRGRPKCEMICIYICTI